MGGNPSWCVTTLLSLVGIGIVVAKVSFYWLKSKILNACLYLQLILSLRCIASKHIACHAEKFHIRHTRLDRQQKKNTQLTYSSLCRYTLEERQKRTEAIIKLFVLHTNTINQGPIHHLKMEKLDSKWIYCTNVKAFLWRYVLLVL